MCIIFSTLLVDLTTFCSLQANPSTLETVGDRPDHEKSEKAITKLNLLLGLLLISIPTLKEKFNGRNWKLKRNNKMETSREQKDWYLNQFKSRIILHIISGDQNCEG